jgi:hypothetical protein
VGASGWSYLVPYDVDVERAFRALRADVFARRDYHCQDPSQKFATIRDLLLAQAEDGTHSILDMNRVTTDPAPAPADLQEMQERLVTAIATGGAATGPHGTVFRMSDAELTACFGTTRPTGKPDDTVLSKLPIERGTGRYVVIYDGGTASALWFAGVSGD